MKANTIFDNRMEMYVYMERYVNEGSPSGFTTVHTTSYETNPFTGKESFYLLEFCDNDCKTFVRGEENELFTTGKNYAHPDSVQSRELIKAGRLLKQSKILVSPTASGRTMLILDGFRKGFLKLTYDVSKIGRCTRDISYIAGYGSIETSNKIKQYIDMKKLPNCFAFLPETSMKVSQLNCKGIFEWGTIFREFNPYPSTDFDVAIIPAFSLFSIDTKNPLDEKLINQFIEISKKDPSQYLWNVLKITVDAYWGLNLNCALRAELHSQNCMYEIDTNFQITRLVIKDMEDVDRDFTLAKHIGIPFSWDTYPFRCYDENSREFKYRASYMYDFKLGEYLLSPIIETVSKKFGLNPNDFEKRVRDYVRDKYLPLLPADYFPINGCWYYCKKVETKPGEGKKFYSSPNPKFR